MFSFCCVTHRLHAMYTAISGHDVISFFETPLNLTISSRGFKQMISSELDGYIRNFHNFPLLALRFTHAFNRLSLRNLTWLWVLRHLKHCPINMLKTRFVYWNIMLSWKFLRPITLVRAPMFLVFSYAQKIHKSD